MSRKEPSSKGVSAETRQRECGRVKGGDGLVV